MRTICIFRDNEDYTRQVTDWLEDFYRRTGKHVETMNPDENVNFCKTYDIVEYPTIITIGNSGEVIAMWRGRTLPLINEVSYYTM